MKKRNLLLFVFLAINIYAKAQTEIGLSIAGYYATQRPANVDIIGSGGGIISIAHSFKLKKDWTVQPQLQINGGRYIMDGIFTKSPTNSYSFDVTPINYKQSVLTMYSFKVPVFLRYTILRDESKYSMPLVSIGLGPYGEYLFSAQQKYKIGIENFKEKAPIQNKFQYGIAMDLGIYGKAIKKNFSNLSFHFGIHYQLSDYLKDNTSFKPIVGYLGLGIGF